MQTLKKSATNRLSTFFSPSLPNNDSHPTTAPPRDAPQTPLNSERNLSTPNLPTGNFSKPLPHRRAPSAQLLNPPAAKEPPRRQTLTKLAKDDDPNGALPPPPAVFGDDGSSYPRSNSSSRNPSPARSYRPSAERSRPATPIRTYPPESPHAAVPSPTDASLGKKGKRKTLLGGHGKKGKEDGPTAWVIGHEGKLIYNLTPLLNGEVVPELWDEYGDTFIHLFPKDSGKGASFKVDSAVYASSHILTRWAHGKLYSHSSKSDSRKKQSEPRSRQASLGSLGNQDLALELRGRGSQSSGSSRGSRTLDSFDSTPREIHIYIPLQLGQDYIKANPGKKPQGPDGDTEALIGIRNLFAFLLGQSLVATEKRSSIFAVLIRISDYLQRFEFGNADGSNFGEVADLSFDGYVEELRIGDVRTSREKTIEGIILSERLRSATLYNEAFVHAVGKYDDIKKLKSDKYPLISPITRNRLERAYMDMELRVNNINNRLKDFEFPAIFAGIANSKTADERKQVDFEGWKSAFMGTRKFFHGCYRHNYGSWPPKASSKKNDLETSGLNRIVLKHLYQDFSMLYDLLVDRHSLTTRTTEGVSAGEDEDDGSERPFARALRVILSEFDRSVPPVQPPVPFDIPLLPDLATTRKDFNKGDMKKDSKARTKRLKDEELKNILRAAHNQDAVHHHPFLNAFLEFESRSARNKTIDEIINLRIGQWIFIYVVIQSLPMLVIDAPNVKWTKGVEYYLCMPPRSRMPWVREDAAIQRSWYGVAGGSGVVSLPNDVIEHGVEGVYRRSHCWLMAEKWAPAPPPPPPPQQPTYVPPPSQPFLPDPVPGAMQPLMGGMPPGMMPQGAVPPGMMPPGVIPQGAIAPGSLPPGSMPPVAFPPGMMQPGAMPSGQMPLGAMSPSPVNQSALHPGAGYPGMMTPETMSPGPVPQTALHPGAMHPGMMPQGTMSPGVMAPSGMPTGAISPGIALPQNPALAAAIAANGADLPPPPSRLLGPDPSLRGARADSPNRRSKRETVMMSGLEALPLPAGVAPSGTPPLRPVSRQDPSKTFDAILSSTDLNQGKKKK